MTAIGYRHNAYSHRRTLRQTQTSAGDSNSRALMNRKSFCLRVIDSANH